MLDKDPFEMEDEEYEAEMEEESARSSESDGNSSILSLSSFISNDYFYSIVDADNTFSLDPAALLSDKGMLNSHLTAEENIVVFLSLVRRIGNTEVRSGFIPSLFSNVPPTIRFCTESQRCMTLDFLSLALVYSL